MKVILLAAGQSKRVKPVEDKNFLRFCGKYLIEHQLSEIISAGFDDIVIVAGAHNIDRLRKISQIFSVNTSSISVVEQENLDEGMAGAVLAAAAEIKDNDIFVVSSNDVVEQKAYDLMRSAAAASSSDSYLLSFKVKEYFPGGYLSVDGSRVTGIIEKPGAGKEPSDLVNVVLHIHKNPKDFIDLLYSTDSEKDDRYEVALNTLIKQKNVESVSYDGYWQPIKLPWHVLELMSHFMESQKPKISDEAQISACAKIKGNVVIESGVKIFDNAVIQGPAYIGKGSVVANNALIRGSCIGENCVVGFSTELARSFIADDTWFHSNYIGDSIIGSNVSFGAGAICANLRFDEKNIGESGRNKLGAIMGDNIRIGVNASIMPGIKIGSNTLVMSGLTISQDIEQNKYVSGKTTLEISENKMTIDGAERTAMMQSLK